VKADVRPRTTGLVVAALAALLTLRALGRGELGTPPVDSVDSFFAWVDARGAVVAAFALLRLVALVLSVYVLAIALLATAARGARAPLLTRAVERVTVPALRRLLGGAGLASLMAIGTATPAVAESAPQPSSDRMVEIPTSDAGPPVTMRELPAREVEPATTEPATTEPATTPPTSSTTQPATTTIVRRSAAATAPAPASPRSWTVAAGECFWSITSDLVHDAKGHAVTDAELIAPWKALIDANRAQLPDPANPDLLYVGTVLTIPALLGAS
jgi:hypothetical protein